MDSALKIYAPIIEEVIDKRSLLLLSKGMYSPLLMAQIITGYYKLKDFPLIIMLNFKREEIPIINEEIKRQQLGDFEIKQITKETTQQRSMLYISSGVYSMTNVILIMDLLQKSLSASIVTAIIINKAEGIEGILDQESWITNMIKRENKDLKVLAISDSIEIIQSTQNFRKIMSSLYLEFCSLWPLSRYEILKDVSDNSDFETFETVIALPKPIKRIQKVLMTLIRTCLDEINNRYKNKNNGEPLLLENDIFNTGLRILMKKMQKIMDRFNLLGNKLFQDIFVFRSLLYDVIHLDAIEFYLKVLRERMKAGSDSIWCYGDQKTLDCLEDLLKISKQRVFTIKRRFMIQEEKEIDEDDEERLLEENQISSQKKLKSQNLRILEEEKEKESSAQKSTGASEISNSSPEKPNTTSDWIINPIEYEKESFDYSAKLDINFKYKTLIDVLKSYQTVDTDPNKPRTVLWINAVDEYTSRKIKNIINGYFSRKDEMKIQQIFRLKTLLECIRGPPQQFQQSNNGNSNSISNSNTFQKSVSRNLKKNDVPIEVLAEGNIQDKLLLELIRLKKDYEKEMMIKVLVSNGADSLALDEALEGLDERHKLEGSNNPSFEEKKENSISNGNKRKHSELPPDLFEGMDDMFIPARRVEEKEFEYKLIDRSKLPLTCFDDLSDDGEVVFDPLQIPGLHIHITTLKVTYEKIDFVLKNNPNILLLFEPDLTMIRETIVMKRCSKYGGMPCNISKIHILMVQNSIESAVYLDYIQRENNAFVSILKERSNIPKFDDDPESRIKKIVPKKYESTRKGKGLGFDLLIGARPIVIVDKREFNSPLPSKLYHDGFWVIPVLLEKGDYILSNSIVVERKSVETGDLLNSIRSGRLETQLTNMCKAFNRPILLIEFSETIDFNLESAEISKPLQNQNWYSGMKGELQEVNRSNVKFYLAWLCMKFPKLTILWSKSTEFTSKFFQRVKSENPEPDLKLFAKYQEDTESKQDTDPALASLEDQKNGSNTNKNTLMKFLVK